MPPAHTTPGRGLARRIARQQREAALLATPAESVDLDRLHQLTQVEAITMPEASAMLRNLIATQHARRATERAAA